MSRLAVVGLFTAFVLVLVGAAVFNQPEQPPAPPVAPDESSAGPLLGASLLVESIGAKSSLIPLGLNADRTIQAPPVSTPKQAGLYTKGPIPGDPGPAVILGHINGGGTPGVFARLSAVKRGDMIKVTRADGREVIFRVYQTETVEKAKFPTAEVYSDTPGPEVRLISCGGALDASAHSYESNIIVFAREG